MLDSKTSRPFYWVRLHSVLGRTLGTGLIVLGASVILGWVLDIEPFKTVLPGFITMKANTAVGFICAGAAVLLILQPPADRLWRAVAMALGVLVLLIGIFTVLEYVLGVNLRIDELLFRDPAQSPYPGRLAPISAMNFCLAGLAIIFFLVPRRLARWSQLLGLMIGLTSALAIIGYVYGVPLLYGSFAYTSMALHTGVGFLMLSFGLLCCRPNEALMSVISSHHAGGWLSRRLIPVAVLLPCLLGALFLKLSGLLGDIRLTMASIVVSQVVLFVAMIWVLSYLLNDSGAMLHMVKTRAEATQALLHEAKTETAETREALSRSEELLRQSQKMEAVGQLAAGIAHDFNNLLAVIVGYSELLLINSTPGDDQSRKLEKIKQAGESAASLTRQLLTFSRHQLVQPTTVDLNKTFTRLNGMLRRLIREDVHLTMVLDPNLEVVRADPGQVEQILLNLVVNPADAMPDGGKLSIQTESVLLDAFTAKRFNALPGQYVRLSVIDTGTGISPEVKPHIFEPFYTTKPIGKGTGLGLATVYGIVQQSGGFLDVESNIGAGSSFRVYLPASVAQEAAKASRELPAVRTNNETVLVVEDSPALRELLTESLQMHGYKVLTAESGPGAVEICHRYSGEIHVVITDVIMPNMNGRELVESVKKIRPSAKIIFMSGYTNDVIMRHGVFNGDAAFIQKPFAPAELAVKITEVIEERHAKLKSA